MELTFDLEKLPMGKQNELMELYISTQKQVSGGLKIPTAPYKVRGPYKKSRQNKRWTTEEDKRISDVYAEWAKNGRVKGGAVKLLSRELHRGEKSITQRAWHLGLTKRKKRI